MRHLVLGHNSFHADNGLASRVRVHESVDFGQYQKWAVQLQQYYFFDL